MVHYKEKQITNATGRKDAGGVGEFPLKPHSNEQKDKDLLRFCRSGFTALLR
jgi:hypothetical protein